MVFCVSIRISVTSKVINTTDKFLILLACCYLLFPVPRPDSSSAAAQVEDDEEAAAGLRAEENKEYLRRENMLAVAVQKMKDAIAAMEAMAQQVADSIVDVSDSVRFSRYKIYFRCSRL